MKKWVFDQTPAAGGRVAQCLLVARDGSIHRFTGESVAGLVTILSIQPESHRPFAPSIYECESPTDVVQVVWHQDNDTGLFWPQGNWIDALAWMHMHRADAVTLDRLQTYMRGSVPTTAERWDNIVTVATAKATRKQSAIGSPPPPTQVVLHLPLDATTPEGVRLIVAAAKQLLAHPAGEALLHEMYDPG